LLALLGLDFDVKPAFIDEDSIIMEGTPEEYVQKLSLLKAKKIADEEKTDTIVIGADTIVVLENQVLNKPIDESDAYKMLRRLSGKTHQVYTGIALVEALKGNSFTTYKKTDVSFRYLEDEEILSYIKSGSPLDKAGSYGIQDDFGAVFVSHINGCYYNIVGLPLELLYTSLKMFSENKSKE
jgi:septum formation protein